MPRLTIRLSDEQKTWLEDEADARECSQADVISDLVDDARGVETGKTLTERVERLEARIDELARTSRHQPDDGDRHQPSPPVTEEQHQPSPLVTKEQHQPAPAVTSDEVEEIVDSVQIPGSDADEIRARRRWLAECLEWMQGQDSVRRADVIARWDGEGLGYETANGLWESLVKPALDELVDRGVVEKPHSRAYRWVGME